MRVVLHETLFAREATPTPARLESEKLSRTKLLTFIQTAHDKRHLLEISSEPCLEHWLQGLPPDMQEDVRIVLDASKRRALDEPAGGSFEVEVGLESKPYARETFACTLSFSEANKLISTKIGVLLENGINDWHFLLAIAPPALASLLIEYKDADLLEPIHGGGNTLIALLKERFASELKRLRSFLMFDCDRHHPDELESSWESVGRKISDLDQAYKVEDLAKEFIPGRYWRLQRRAIENYLSPGDLECFVSAQTQSKQKELKPKLDVFRLLSPPARWYYPMKDGFQKQRETGKWTRSKDLYPTLTPEQLETLSTGFRSEVFASTIDAVKAQGRPMSWDAAAREEAGQALHTLWRLL